MIAFARPQRSLATAKSSRRPKSYKRLVFGFLFLFCAATPIAAAPGDTSLVVASAPSSTAIEGATAPSISSNGRYVIYRSTAPNLIDADNNLLEDVFVFDRTTGANTKIEDLQDCETPFYDGYELTDEELASFLEVWRWSIWTRYGRPTSPDHSIDDATQRLQAHMTQHHHVDVEYNTLLLLRQELEPMLYLRLLWDFPRVV